MWSADRVLEAHDGASSGTDPGRATPPNRREVPSAAQARPLQGLEDTLAARLLSPPADLLPITPRPIT
jgi:hypothetical protein